MEVNELLLELYLLEEVEGEEEDDELVPELDELDAEDDEPLLELEEELKLELGEERLLLEMLDTEELSHKHSDKSTVSRCLCQGPSQDRETSLTESSTL